MSAVCPAGHTSTAEDYCDVCGAPIEAAPEASAATPPAAGGNAGADGRPECPNCGTPNASDALFCENCGYDFTTQTMPRPLPAPDAAPAGPPPDSGSGQVDRVDEPDAGSVVEVWVDPAWYEAQQSPDPMPSPGLPEVVPLRGSSLLVGRTSVSRNIHPEIALEEDTGVSRRHAQLTTDGRRWWVEDLDSANGTFVAPASAPLPADPIPVGVKRELGDDDRLYLGAWTRLVIRPATDDERHAGGHSG